MKKTFILLTLLFLVCSCSDNDSGSNSQLFRNTYNNTSWIDADGVIYNFKAGKLFYLKDADLSIFYEVGTYNNIEYDACVYNTVNNVIDSEDNDTFTIRQITSTGVGSFCPASSAKITFQVLNANTIEIQTNYDGFIDSFLINKTNNISTQNAVDGTSIGYLW
ncbi:hypothetical protein MCEGE10_01579 [Flavobacteriaceae bacterium]